MNMACCIVCMSNMGPFFKEQYKRFHLFYELLTAMPSVLHALQSWPHPCARATSQAFMWPNEYSSIVFCASEAKEVAKLKMERPSNEATKKHHRMRIIWISVVFISIFLDKCEVAMIPTQSHCVALGLKEAASYLNFGLKKFLFLLTN